MKDKSVTIRFAEEKDLKTVLHFIVELAKYEKLEHEVVASEEKLAQTLFGERKYAEVLLAELHGQPVGFALFFHNYSTFLAKPGLYLEDLYVSPSSRGNGVGKRLFQKLCQVAKERECGRVEWWVLDWNQSAIDFYLSIGAKAMDEWTVFRLEESAIANLAQG